MHAVFLLSLCCRALCGPAGWLANALNTALKTTLTATLTALLITAGSGQASAAGQLLLEEAEFVSDTQTTALAVALPDTWKQRGHRAGGVGHYRLRFELPTPVGEVWALHAERLSTAHEVRLNGVVVHGSLQAPQRAMRPVPTLITMPTGLLKVGENRLDIAVATETRGGLSTLTLGPAHELAIRFERLQQRAVGLPQVLNVVGAGVSMFMLLLWWRRRSESVLGSFGGMGLLASLRNVAYFEPTFVLTVAGTSWLFMQAQLATTLLLCWFAMSYAQRRPAWYRGVLLAVAVLFPVLSLWGVLVDAAQLARQWLYPALFLLALPGLVLLAQAAWRRRTPTDASLMASLVGVLGAGVHDYFFQLSHLSVMGQFWIPFAVPLMVVAFSALQLDRLLRGMDEAQRMNVTLERRVLERTHELQAANAAKTRFLAAASHDLRQPMVSIGLLVGLMSEQALSAPVRRVVQRLQDATGAMETLLTRLLDLSRLQAGAVRLQRQPLLLQDLFDAAAAQHLEQALRKGLQLRIRPTLAVVDGDPALLAQILGNLVGNAVRYTQQGGVLLGARAAGPAHWRVAVWDTGPGIPSEQHERIFGEFVRGDAPLAAEESVTGLGLGLAIVQRSAALMGAPVALRSRLNRGSCFSVLLPSARAAVPGPAPAAPRRVQLTPLRGRRVWLLEDNAHARASLSLLLQHWGAEVQAFASLKALRLAHATAAGAAESAKSACSNVPDLLLTDLRLPDGEGTEALLLLRSTWPGLPVLIVTGNTAPAELAAEQAWRDAGVQVLLKPFASDTLLATVSAALAGTPPTR